jgi:penicillin-insensitive murein endopeptidase
MAYSSQSVAPAAVGELNAIASDPTDVPEDVPVPRERPLR